MRSLLRSALLVASVLVTCWGITGCSTEPENNTGKMGAPWTRRNRQMGGTMDKVDLARWATMDKMDTRKMDGTMDKMDTGKMDGPMDKMK